VAKRAAALDAARADAKALLAKQVRKQACGLRPPMQSVLADIPPPFSSSSNFFSLFSFSLFPARLVWRSLTLLLAALHPNANLPKRLPAS